jgi:hypothetical protein
MSRHVIVKPLGTRLLLAFALAAVAAVAAAAPADAISGGTADSATAPYTRRWLPLGTSRLPTCRLSSKGPPCRRASRRSWPTRCPPGPDFSPPATARRKASSSTSPSPRTPRPPRRRGRRFLARWYSNQAPAMTKATPRTWASSRSRTPSSRRASPPRRCPRPAHSRRCARAICWPSSVSDANAWRRTAVPRNLRCGNFTRRYTTAPFQALRPFILALNANTASGAQGGACFADSGGPVFRPDDARPRAVLATTQGGNPLCNTVERLYRTDTPTARDFLRSQGIAVP